jgi:hypothetical protein
MVGTEGESAASTQEVNLISDSSYSCRASVSTVHRALAVLPCGSDFIVRLQGGSATMTSKVLSSAKEAAISLLKGTTPQKEPVPTPSIPNTQEDSEGPASPPEDAAERGEEGNAGRVKQEAAKMLDAEARVADAEAREEKLRAMREEVERSQVEEKKRALRGLDPSCWEKLAEQGYFQKAEDQV